MKFSIIVPIYNVEKYIVRCLNSIIRQSFDDFELIIVNDGTKDKSVIITEQILSNSRLRWKIINKENGGQGSARNVGVSYAMGEYLVFIDSDDYIELTMLETVNRIIEENQADLICFNSTMVDENGKSVKLYEMCGSLSGQCSIEKNPEMLIFPPAMWNKVVNREFFIRVGCTFLEGVIYEDTVVSRALMLQADKIYFLKEALYFYVQRSNSTMGQGEKKGGNPKIMDIIKANEALIQWLKNKSLFNKYYYEIETIAVNTVLFYALDILNMSDRKDKRQNELVDFFNSNFSDIEKNQYLSKKDKTKIAILNEYKFSEYYRKFGSMKKIKTIIKSNMSKLMQYVNVRK